jgi:hypothetical protein
LFWLQIVYGIEVQSMGDPYIETAEKAMKGLGEAGLPGTFFVDILPIRAFLFIAFALEF